MKKLFALALVAALSLTVLSGCAGAGTSAAEGKTPEELTQLYADAITAHGGEMVEYNPVISEAKEDDGSAMLLELMGLKAEDMKAFGISTSMMNVKAYGIAAVMPVEGKEEAVEDALENYVEQKQGEFEFYLPDQYQVALDAEVETLEDGTVLMVMTENGDQVFDAISGTILGE